MLGVTEEELDVFVLQCEKGYSNTRERDTAVKNPAPFDVPIKLKDRSNCNVLCLHYETFGRKGSADVRHFSFDNLETPRDRSKRTISFQKQQELIKWIDGSHSYFSRTTRTKGEAKERERAHTTAAS